MASRNIDLLVPELKEKAQALVEKAPFEVLIYCTVRSAEEQAKLWRQSRSTKVIKEKIEVLNRYGHKELAEILNGVGPQSGPPVTHAGPGESWHQYGQAFDCVPMINGKPVWDVHKNKTVWVSLGTLAIDLGLNWGGNWPKWADYPHFQLPITGNPLKQGLKGCYLRDSDLK